MVTVTPLFITDDTGKKISVVLPIKEYKAIMEELEAMEDVKLYDEAKKDDNGERIPLSEYIKTRKAKNA